MKTFINHNTGGKIKMGNCCSFDYSCQNLWPYDEWKINMDIDLYGTLKQIMKIHKDRRFSFSPLKICKFLQFIVHLSDDWIFSLTLSEKKLNKFIDSIVQQIVRTTSQIKYKLRGDGSFWVSIEIMEHCMKILSNIKRICRIAMSSHRQFSSVIDAMKQIFVGVRFFEKEHKPSLDAMHMVDAMRKWHLVNQCVNLINELAMDFASERDYDCDYDSDYDCDHDCDHDEHTHGKQSTRNRDLGLNIVEMVEAFVAMRLLSVVNDRYDFSFHCMNHNHIVRVNFNPNINWEIFDKCLRIINTTLAKAMQHTNNDNQCVWWTHIWLNVFEKIFSCHYLQELKQMTNASLEFPRSNKHMEMVEKACHVLCNLMCENGEIVNQFVQYGLSTVIKLLHECDYDFSSTSTTPMYIEYFAIKNVFVSLEKCEWKYMIRYIWIGYYKNDKKNNKKCYIYLLPKDIVKYLIKYLWHNASITIKDCTY